MRLALGLPFLKLTDLKLGIDNIRRCASKLTKQRAIDFAEELVKYIEKEWMNRPHKHWNMFQISVRTNNRAEGTVYLYKRRN